MFICEPHKGASTSLVLAIILPASNYTYTIALYKSLRFDIENIGTSFLFLAFLIVSNIYPVTHYPSGTFSQPKKSQKGLAQNNTPNNVMITDKKKRAEKYDKTATRELITHSPVFNVNIVPFQNKRCSSDRNLCTNVEIRPCLEYYEEQTTQCFTVRLTILRFLPST